MFDPILELRRRRMQSGFPQITGNIQPPDAGPDIAPIPAPQMSPMQMQAPEMAPGPDFSGVAQLGAERGLNLLMKKLKKPDPEAGGDVLKSLPALKNLFRRTS